MKFLVIITCSVWKALPIWPIPFESREKMCNAAHTRVNASYSPLTNQRHQKFAYLSGQGTLCFTYDGHQCLGIRYQAQVFVSHMISRYPISSSTEAYIPTRIIFIVAGLFQILYFFLLPSIHWTNRYFVGYNFLPSSPDSIIQMQQSRD